MSTEVNERFNAEILKTLEEKRQCRPSDTAALLLALDARLRVIEVQLAAIARAFDSNSGNLT